MDDTKVQEIECRTEEDAIELARLFTLWSSKMGVFRDGKILRPQIGSEHPFLVFFSSLNVRAPHITLERGLEE